MNRSYFVYMMTNKNNTVIYTGVTSDIVKRVFEHKERQIEGSFTKKYNVNKLVYYETTPSIESAILKEKQIKAGSRKKKIMLIQKTNPKWQDLSTNLF